MRRRYKITRWRIGKNEEYNRVVCITFYNESTVNIGMVTYELEKPLTLTPHNLVGESDY